MKFLSFNFLWILSLCLLSVSCSKDEPGNNSQTTKEEKKILGCWEISNLPSRAGSNFMIFMENKNLYYNNEKYSWEYNSETGILATTSSYTWQVNIITDDAWSGYYYQSGGTYTATATKRLHLGMAYILQSATWMNGNEECPLSAKVFYGDSSYFYFNWSSSPSSVTIEESPSKDKAIIIRDNDPEQKVYTLYNPYNLEKAYLVTPEGEKFYPKNITI